MNRYYIVTILFFVSSALQAQQTLPENEHDCFIVPSVMADVGSPVRGVVARLLVDRGDSVSQGQPIAELESDMEQIMLSHAQARVDMTSELAARDADLKLATQELTRVEDMHAQLLAPSQQRDESRARKQIAKAGLAQALENRELIKIELKRAKHELEQRTLRSPTNGVVVEQFIVPGEFINDEPIMNIAMLDPLRVEVVLPANLFGSVRVGGRASITPELETDIPLTATIDAVDGLLDTRSGTFGVRLKLPNANMAIPSGQKCIADFLEYKVDNAYNSYTADALDAADASDNTVIELAEEAE